MVFLVLKWFLAGRVDGNSYGDLEDAVDHSKINLGFGELLLRRLVSACQLSKVVCAA